MIAKGKIRVLLVDDSELILKGLSAFFAIKTNIEVIGQAPDGKQAIDLAFQLRPNVIIMDVDMPVLDGIEATRAILHRYPCIKVIMHTFLFDKIAIEKMSEVGACNFLQKGCSLNDLTKAIDDAVNKTPTSNSHLFKDI